MLCSHCKFSHIFNYLNKFSFFIWMRIVWFKLILLWVNSFKRNSKPKVNNSYYNHLFYLIPLQNSITILKYWISIVKHLFWVCNSISKNMKMTHFKESSMKTITIPAVKLSFTGLKSYKPIKLKLLFILVYK